MRSNLLLELVAAAPPRVPGASEIYDDDDDAAYTGCS